MASKTQWIVWIGNKKKISATKCCLHAPIKYKLSWAECIATNKSHRKENNVYAFKKKYHRAPPPYSYVKDQVGAGKRGMLARIVCVCESYWALHQENNFSRVNLADVQHILFHLPNSKFKTTPPARTSPFQCC